MRTLKFEDLSLSPEILSGLNDVQYQNPTPLQQSVIPSLLEGKDVLLKANPGEDKRGAIVIPVLEKFSCIEEHKGTHILIVTPSSQQAKELDELIWAMGYHAQIECASIDEEGEFEEQQNAVINGIPILVATPKRLLDILQDNLFIFRHIDLLVLDDVQEFNTDELKSVLKKINKRILSTPQNFLLSRELSEATKKISGSLLSEPEIIGFDEVQSNGKALQEPPSISNKLSQGYIYVPNRMKITTLMAHIEASPTDTCVIFTASKRGTDRLYRILRKRGLKATSLHGKLSDEKRAQRFANFTNGDVQYLLVADIPAIELGLERVTQVINYDVPGDPDEYRYRANMVGSGKATRIVSLVSKQDRSDINELSNELGQAPKELPLPDEVKKKLKQRKNKKRGHRQNNKNNRSQKNRKKKRPKKRMELPRPSYDKLSGGRSGDTSDERTGVVEFFKKLFS